MQIGSDTHMHLVQNSCNQCCCLLSTGYEYLVHQKQHTTQTPPFASRVEIVLAVLEDKHAEQAS